jgi:glycerophosphoryl diester phosphodiesterase
VWRIRNRAGNAHFLIVRNPDVVPSIIAHRGASAYLPEHSLPAKALAYGMGADFLEQDVIASRDGHLMVLHDLILDDVSTVAKTFPNRARADGHYYCIDFDLEELQKLKFGERIDATSGRLLYPDRFPREAGLYAPVTLHEEILFVQNLNRASGRRVGIYPELKHAEWHRQQGIDLTDKVLNLLQKFGYLAGGGDPVFLQCFDPEELKRARKIVGPGLPMIQLISSQTEITDGLLHEIARYAAGIGPSIKLIYRGRDTDGTPQTATLVEAAHNHGLAVHPYTFRADDLPAGFDNFEALLELFICDLGVDGVFTDFTDRVANFRDHRGSMEN